LTSLGQSELIGQVIDQDSKESLPFVNIGFVGKNKGTVSDGSGYLESIGLFDYFICP